ncbi:plastocyanin/azurin family copper-binding protein [Rubrivirga marina]|uniref:plastocyanin/azurin family copper-binding protein n=1 Tax=Rubrivirga marina TaxID=1196024 RepID=UPI000BA92091|nr:plastocyanin/azurin family copper-binding protein [Rubrivirga marina]
MRSAGSPSAAVRVGRLGVVAAALVWLGAGCAEPPGPSPEQQAIFAQEVDQELVVPAVRNAMSYAVGEVTAPAGATVRLVMDNSTTTSPAMVHNVVVVQSEAAVERVGREAAGAPDNIPEDEAILFYTPLARPGQRTAVVFTMPPPGRYPFLCTYPGHFRFMQGTLVSTPAD